MRWKRTRKKRELTMMGLQQVGVDVRVALLLRTGGGCWYCGNPLTMASVTVDHVVPLARGGNPVFDNLVACCNECNTAKGQSTLEEFRRRRGGRRFWGEHRAGESPR